MTPASQALVDRLREYGGEVLNTLEGAAPPYSNSHECAVAALDAADHIEKLDKMAYLTIRLPWRRRRA